MTKCKHFFLIVQHLFHSDSSLATGSSEGSLQSTVEDGLSFGISPLQNLDLPESLFCPLPSLSLHPQRRPTADQGPSLLKRQSSAATLQATHRQHKSQSSIGGENANHGCPQQDSIKPSDDEVDMGTCRDICHQTLKSEHLSATLNSLSLTSLFTPDSVASTLMKKCNSTGSLDQSSVSTRSRNSRHFHGIDAHGFLSKPWTAGRARGAQEDNMTSFSMESSSRSTQLNSRKKR